MLPLQYQGLALPNPNIDALSTKIHLLQSHWDTGSTSGRMLHQVYQVFQIEISLGGNIFLQFFVTFGRFTTHGFFRNLWYFLNRYGVVFHLHANFDIPLLREHERTLRMQSTILVFFIGTSQVLTSVTHGIFTQNKIH
jgi:hypothetical protein